MLNTLKDIPARLCEETQRLNLQQMRTSLQLISRFLFGEIA
jgi:hypothetical protein